MQGYSAAQMSASWRLVRKNTIQVAEEIPADQYDFRGAPDTMTVGEMLAHLAMATHWAEQVHFVEKKHELGGADFGRYFSEAGAASALLTNKQAIIDALITRGEGFALHLDAMTDEQLGETVSMPFGGKSRFEMLLSVKEHEMHHRAQLMLIERMLGIVPHLTRARQARQSS